MKSYIPSFNEYLKEEDEKFISSLIKEIKDFNEKDPFPVFIKSLLSEKCIMLKEEEKAVLSVIHANGGAKLLMEGNLPSDSIMAWFNNISEEEKENIFNKWKDKAAIAFDTLKQKGKDALSKSQEMIVRVGNNFTKVIKLISAAISKFLKGAWEYLKKSVDATFAGVKEKIIEAAKPKIKKDQQTAVEETKNMGSMCKAGINYFVGKVPKDMEQGMQKAANETSESTEFTKAFEKATYFALAELISEGVDITLDEDEHGHGHDSGVNIPFISALAKKLSNFPPFSWIHHIEGFVAKNANNALEKLSALLTKFANAPGPFEFIVLGTIFALIVADKLKAGVAELVHEVGMTAVGAAIAVAIPGLGTILYVLKKIATVLWYVAVVEIAIQATKGLISDKEINTVKVAVKDPTSEEDKKEKEKEKE